MLNSKPSSAGVTSTDSGASAPDSQRSGNSSFSTRRAGSKGLGGAGVKTISKRSSPKRVRTLSSMLGKHTSRLSSKKDLSNLTVWLRAAWPSAM